MMEFTLQKVIPKRLDVDVDDESSDDFQVKCLKTIVFSFCGFKNLQLIL